MWLHSDSTAFSSRQWQTPGSRVLSEANSIIGPFDSDTAQIRDKRENRLIFFPYPDLKFVLHPESKMDTTRVYAYLPGRVDLHNIQKRFCTYSVLILLPCIRWLHM